MPTAQRNTSRIFWLNARSYAQRAVGKQSEARQEGEARTRGRGGLARRSPQEKGERAHDKQKVSFCKVHRKARGRREHTTRRRCLFAKSTARQEGEESGRSAYVPEVGGLARRPPQGKREKRANDQETVSYVHAHTHTHTHRHKEILESQCPRIFTM